jgi:predicted SAM-dependent methyltransferase
LPRGGRIVASSAVEGVTHFRPDEIDVAVLSSFLEHEAQPLALLRNLHRVLKPGASVIIKVPNYACWSRRLRGPRWPGFRFPDHVNYFTPATLRTLAERAGFRIARQTLLDRFPLSDSMYAVLQKAPLQG